MDIWVREAAAEDAHRVRDIHIESIERLAGETYTSEQISAWAHDREPDAYPIESEDTYFILAEDAKKTVGFGWLKLTGGEYFHSVVDGEIAAIYVHPSVARHGVGSRICEELEGYAVRDNVDSIGLWASLNSVPFYESQGYNRVTERVHSYDGIELTVVEMVKQTLR